MANGSGGGRHLARSTLYEEDTFRGGHTAAWGSYYDPEQRRWGYRCCRSVARSEACPLRPVAITGGGNATDAEDAAAASGALGEWHASKMLDAGAEVPSRPSARHDIECSDEEYLSRFVRYWFHAWISDESCERRPDGKSVEQTKQALVVLLQNLRRKYVPQDFLRGLVSFADLSTQREYQKANDVYVSITIGKALWHSHLDLGEQRAHWNGGGGLRTMQKQVVEKDHKNATLFDTDASVQRYVHALKRLVTHMQLTLPSADPSKMGHAPAPVPDASELGLPVMLGVRDSDGRQRQPEYMEPLEAAAVTASRGIAFGTTAGHAHPFQGIGSARGV